MGVKLCHLVPSGKHKSSEYANEKSIVINGEKNVRMNTTTTMGKDRHRHDTTCFQPNASSPSFLVCLREAVLYVSFNDITAWSFALQTYLHHLPYKLNIAMRAVVGVFLRFYNTLLPAATSISNLRSYLNCGGEKRTFHCCTAHSHEQKNAPGVARKPSGIPTVKRHRYRRCQ